jgi:hypothetical protein
VTVEHSPRTIEPLEYHRAVVQRLRSIEPEVWEWASSVRAKEDHADAVRADLLRHTYRLTDQSHPRVIAAGVLAAQRLGLTIPVTLYQGGDGPMNASLFFLPEEAHVVFFGPVLERLSEPELLALMGHELSHHIFWTIEGGAFHTADRVLQQTSADPTAAPAFHETARRYSLYTEVFADRGAALAANSTHPAISTLVKIQTGIASVDAEAYLRQAREVDAREKTPSRQESHPEGFLRAHAVDAWWTSADNLASWLSARIEGPLSLESLDVIGQQQLQDLCRRFICRLLQEPRLANERTATQAQAYFPGLNSAEPSLDLGTLLDDGANESVRSFLCTVLLDFALVDPDIRDDALIEAGRLAIYMGSEKEWIASLKQHLGLNKRALDKLSKQWARVKP